MKVFKGRYRGNRILTYSENINIVIQVPHTIEMSIVDSGSTFISGSKTRSVDLGVIDQNITSESFDILIQSNSSFVIKASSQNNGSLAHVSDANYLIPYSFYVNNILQGLNGSSSSPLIIGNGSGPNVGTDGLRFPLKVEINNTGNTLSGLHQDVIQITVETSL